MPWKELKPMDEKLLFVSDHLRETETFSGLCARYGISRRTGYKWVARYEAEGAAGLSERSRRPREHPDQVPAGVRRAILALRGRGRAELGPKKIQALLRERLGEAAVPCRTTIYKILKQAGRIVPRRERRRVPLSGRPLRDADQPNMLWSADFKGQFLTGDGQWCYPLTIMDHASRYLLVCRGLASTRTQTARLVFEHAFREYGLPERLRTDNGVPFASLGQGGLSKLSVWWIRLGIVPERIAPGHPEQNGRHERMHRTLKRAVARPAAANAQAQQRRFNRFSKGYNTERPHEALSQRRPGDLYAPSTRPYPHRLPELIYPPYMQTHKVCDSGVMYWRARRIYIGHVLAQEQVGLEQIGDTLWEVWFGPVRLGRFDERDTRPGDDYLTIKSVTHVREHFC